MRIWDRAWVHVAALLALAAAAFLPDLGQDTDIESREDRHAEIAREMVESGNYAVPHLCGQPYIDKPPLFNWVVALLFRLTGRIDYAVARFPSVVMSTAAMLGIYALGRRWFSARAGLFAAAIWATSWLVVEWSRFARMDMMLASLILVAIVLADLAAAARRGWAQAGAWAGACAVLGAASLAKGPHAVFFFGVAAMALWRARRGRWLPPVRLLLLGAALVVLIVGGWAVATEARHPGHLRELVNYQFGLALHEHPKRVCLYIDQLLVRTVPWGLFAIGAAWWSTYRFRRFGYDFSAVAPLVLGVCVLALSAPSNKRIHFLLPAVPMWTLWLGAFLDRSLTLRAGTAEPSEELEPVPKWAFEWPLRAALTVGLAVTIGAAAVWGMRAVEARAAGALVLALAAGLALAGTVAAWRGRLARATAMLFLTCAVLGAAASPLSARYATKIPEKIAALRQIAEAILPGVPVAEHHFEHEYLYFLMNRPVLFAQSLEALRPFLETPGPRYIIVDATESEAVRRLTPRPLREVGAWSFGESTVVVLSTEPAAGARRR